jgi:hypothetical protein
MIKFLLHTGVIYKDLKEYIEIDLPPEQEHLRDRIKTKLSEITALFKTREMLTLPDQVGMYTTVTFAGQTYKITKNNVEGWTVSTYGNDRATSCNSIHSVRQAIAGLAGNDFVDLISPKSKQGPE